jgi:TolB-like protein
MYDDHMLAPILALLVAASPKLAVMPITAGEGVPASTAAAVTEALAAEVRRRSGAEVVTRKEIEAVLSLEAQKQMLGCQSDACIAELGGALGVERLVAGDLARLGESWLFHLKVVETGKVKVAAQSDRRIRGGTIDDVLDALPPMAAELFPGAGPTIAAPASSMLPAVPAAAAKPAPVPWAEEPVAVEPGPRDRRAVFTDGAGHFITVVLADDSDEPVFSGDAKKLFRAWRVGGGRDGQGGWSITFWDPRFPSGWQRSLEGREGKVDLQCGDRKVPLRRLLPPEARTQLAGVKPFQPRWRRYPHALARDDDGNYYLLEGARGVDARPLPRADFRLWVGPKARMAQLELVDVARDGGGLLAISPTGKFALKYDPSGKPKAEWLTASGTRSLTWLAPEDHGPLIYGELSVWAGQQLGTPCDPFITHR